MTWKSTNHTFLYQLYKQDRASNPGGTDKPVESSTIKLCEGDVLRDKLRRNDVNAMHVKVGWEKMFHVS